VYDLLGVEGTAAPREDLSPTEKGEVERVFEDEREKKDEREDEDEARTLPQSTGDNENTGRSANGGVDPDLIPGRLFPRSECLPIGSVLAGVEVANSVAGTMLTKVKLSG